MSTQDSKCITCMQVQASHLLFGSLLQIVAGSETFGAALRQGQIPTCVPATVRSLQMSKCRGQPPNGLTRVDGAQNRAFVLLISPPPGLNGQDGVSRTLRGVLLLFWVPADPRGGVHSLSLQGIRAIKPSSQIAFMVARS